MKNFWLRLVLLCTLFALPFNALMADEIDIRADHPSTYTVVKGDTLWDVSAKFLHSPWLWPEIWQANPQINNPHLIYPGDILKLIYLDGRPRLVVNRGTMKLTPQMRTSPLDDAIPAIPLEAINTFLSRSRVVDKERLEAAPYVLAGTNHRIISGAGDKVYAAGNFVENTNVYGIYRKGQTFVDPVTREKLGIQATDIGTGRIVVDADENGVTSLSLNSSNEEVRVGDRFMPFADDKVSATFYPKAPEGDVDGVIIAVEGGVSHIGAFDVVVINRGERENIQTGDVLAVSKVGEKVKDRYTRKRVQLPSERAGLLIIFKVFDKVSYGLVLGAEQPLSVFDAVSNP